MTVKTQEMKDGWVLFRAEGWKGHWCPTSLLPGLMEDCAVRGYGPGAHEPVLKGFIDLPGMVLQDRSIEELEVDGFTLRIPSEDFEYFYGSLKSHPEREFSDGRKYYKIHGWLHCAIFTPEQREALLAVMDARADGAKKRAKADTDRFQAAIAKINEGGVKVITSKAPESLPKVKLSGKPNKEKN